MGVRVLLQEARVAAPARSQGAPGRHWAVMALLLPHQAQVSRVVLHPGRAGAAEQRGLVGGCDRRGCQGASGAGRLIPAPASPPARAKLPYLVSGTVS